ncbi:MAG: isoprenylcysteine carboxylmethyltransferase family protein [Spirochaetales bacterium]|nr:isoprenylcysteine carboxylmethyltransferase family protein [Spirochaetales bacterium]
MDGSLFRICFICLFCVLTGMRLHYKLRAGLLRERLYAREENVGFIVFRSVLGVPLLWAVFAYAFLPERFPWMYLALPSWLRLVGVILGCAAIALLFWVHQSLDGNFSTSLAPRREHRMVTRGPYAWVRHPMYSAYFTLFLAAFLISRNWLTGATGLAIILMLMSFRRIREEALLVERFGEEYRRYGSSTGMFLPRLSAAARRPPVSAKRRQHEQEVGGQQPHGQARAHPHGQQGPPPPEPGRGRRGPQIDQGQNLAGRQEQAEHPQQPAQTPPCRQTEEQEHVS